MNVIIYEYASKKWLNNKMMSNVALCSYNYNLQPSK